jgi:SOS-response transcriptional repressor LexA
MLTQSIALCRDESTDLLNRQAVPTTIKAMIDTTAERLQYALKQSGIKNAEIAEACGITPQAVSGWLKTGRISKNALYVVEAKTGFNAQWISTGKGPERGSLSVSESPATYATQLIPLISWVQAGAMCEAIDIFQPGDSDVWLPCPTNHSKHTFALRVEGDSMVSPFPHVKSYPPGTIIFVDPDRPVYNGAKVVARVPLMNTVTFKQYSMDAGRIYLVALNPSYKPIEISEETHLCGVVIGSYMEE